MMQNIPISLVLSDVDGTLVTTDKVLTAAAVAAARGLHAAGIGLALASARPPCGMRMLVEPLDLRLPLAGFNGGLIVDRDFNVIERHPIDPDAARAAAQIVRDCGIDLWVYTEHDWVVPGIDRPLVEHESGIIRMKPSVRDSTADELTRAYKIVGVSDDRARVAAAHEKIVASLGDRVSATRSSPFFIDVTDRGANKGAVVHALASLLAVPPARIATIGDMPNDVLMFAQSGFSIAMGNADPDVQRQASAVTASNDDDGFAQAINRFILSPDRA